MRCLPGMAEDPSVKLPPSTGDTPRLDDLGAAFRESAHNTGVGYAHDWHGSIRE